MAKKTKTTTLTATKLAVIKAALYGADEALSTRNSSVVGNSSIIILKNGYLNNVRKRVRKARAVFEK